MAIAIEGYTVVAQYPRIDEKFSGGLKQVSEIVPNATELHDGHLWRCSFMAMSDAEHFISLLANGGLEVSKGPDSDVVIVNEFDHTIEPYCEWLVVKTWQKGVIAWLEGTDPKKLIVREGWTPEKGSGLQFARRDQMENLDFLRREGNVEVYRNKETGKEVFIGRTQVDHEQLFQEASKIIIDHMIHPGQPVLNGEAASEVQEAVKKLEQIVSEADASWQTFWMIGKGRQSLGEMERALEAFRKAWELEQSDEAIPRELAGTCLELGYAKEAVEVGEKAAGLQPDHPETLGNLACAYLMDARLDEADTTIQAALRFAPNDQVNQHIQQCISDVRSGAIPQPHKLRDLTRRSKKKPPQKESIWSRLKFWKK